MGKNFELNGRTRINALPKAGFTHLEGQCARCGEIRRREIAALDWVIGVNSIEGVRRRARCNLCGAPLIASSFGPWSPTNFWRGPR